MDDRYPIEYRRENRMLPLVEGGPAYQHFQNRHISVGVEPRSVRISLTDRCDYACTYCRPSRKDGPAERRLPLSAWKTIFEGLKRSGVRRVRLTGGEPLLFPDIVAVVVQLTELGFEDVSLTTNGSQLPRLAKPLRRAGLHRVNISLDSLKDGRFYELTRGGVLKQVLLGIDAALSAGLGPVKTNTVVLKGNNDEEMESILLWAWSKGLVPRFLEIMPIGEAFNMKEMLVSAASMRKALSAHLREEAGEEEPGLGPAKYVRSRRDPSLRAGFITGASETFCNQCDRLRISSSGKLLPCLAMDEGVSAKYEAMAGDSDGIAALVRRAWARKPDGQVWKGCNEEGAAHVSMRAVGG